MMFDIKGSRHPWTDDPMRVGLSLSWMPRFCIWLKTFPFDVPICRKDLLSVSTLRFSTNFLVKFFSVLARSLIATFFPISSVDHDFQQLLLHLFVQSLDKIPCRVFWPSSLCLSYVLFLLPLEVLLSCDEFEMLHNSPFTFLRILKRYFSIYMKSGAKSQRSSHIKRLFHVMFFQTRNSLCFVIRFQ